MIQSLFRLCSNIETDYQRLFEDALRNQGVNEKGIKEIVNHFDYQKEMIFSLNKAYQSGQYMKAFCEQHGLSKRLVECLKLDYPLYVHQEKAILSILNEECTIISTGTGSGKTESFLIPLIDYCFKHSEKGVKAILIYPMNALAGDQMRRIQESVRGTNITYGVFNGETPNTEAEVTDVVENGYGSKESILANLPDILITNYVMLEHMLTNPKYRVLFEQSSKTLKFMVLDEIHTYKGNKAADVSYLLQRFQSLLAQKSVLIGCSATLSRSKAGTRQQGYIDGDIDTFIQDMFNLKEQDSYTYIEPQYEALKLSKEAEKDVKAVWIAGHLYKGAMSLREIQEGLQSVDIQLSKEEILDYLEYLRQKKWLDFRVHFFMLQLKDTLKRCLGCGSYYTSHIQKCHKCGQMVLPVYKKNPSYLVGKIQDQEIVYPQTPIEKQEVIVLIGTYKEGHYPYSLRFEESYLTEKGLRIVADPTGSQCLVLDQELNNEGIGSAFIKLEGKDSQDLVYESMTKLLLQLPLEERKLLAFVDDREKCGRHSANVGDRLLSDFYEIMMIRQIQQTPQYSIKQLAKAVKEEIETSQDMAKELSKEFNVWLRKWARNIKVYDMEIVPRIEGSITTDEAEIIEVFVREGAFKMAQLDEEGEVIKIGWKSYSRPKVITLGGGASEVLRQKNYQGISLAESAQKYTHLVKKYNQGQLESIFASLIRKNLIYEEKEEGAYYYFLNVNAFRVNVLRDAPKLSHLSLKELKQMYLCFAGAHSAEVEKEKKKVYESKFQEGALQVLFSTPTLEMGIDIGSLHFVYMLGVPPTPSSYAQRTGRAGRRSDKFAGLIVLCDESKNHDWYYFQNPKEMIEGTISPPKFDKNNNQVLNKHINTYLLTSPYGKCNNLNIEQMQSKLERIFKRSINMQKQLVLTHRLQQHLMAGRDCYECGLYPQYGFRKDTVKLYDLKQEEISNREPEQAYKMYIPKEEMYIGDTYHRILPNQRPTSTFAHPKNQSQTIMCYETLICEKATARSEKREFGKKVSEIYFKRKQYKPFVDYVMLKGYIEKDLEINFITQLLNQPEMPFIGYQRYRDSLILSFDKKIMDEGYYLSFISAFDRTLKDELGFDESEIGILFDEDLAEEVKEEGRYTVCFYDKGTVKNFDVEEIQERWQAILVKMYEKVKACKCKAEKGCYLCLRGQVTQKIAHLVERKKLIALLGHLVCNQRFAPSIHFHYETVIYDKVFTLFQRGKLWILEDETGEKFQREDMGEQNLTIFELLIETLRHFYETGDVKTVTIKSSLKYLVDALNEEAKVKQNIEAYKRYKFYTLVFEEVTVKGGEA
nr:DEAD/DEAH box helicase [uncultured Niameybacter sp.]